MKWEYKIAQIGRSIAQIGHGENAGTLLRQLGEEGWELIFVANDSGGKYTFFFKRPKQS